jgi:hypothetical protein
MASLTRSPATTSWKKWQASTESPIARRGSLILKPSKELRRRLTEAFTLGKDVVVDNTNLTAKARRRILSRVPEGWEKVGVIFDVPEQWLVHRVLCRAEAGGKRVAPWLVSRMRLDWVPPVPDDFDRILIVRPGCEENAAGLLFLRSCPGPEPTRCQEIRRER